MSTILPTSNDLLTYNPTHKILICLTCQYAIQKSALPSHLLRHKIYRHEKARLLDSISLLNLLEPDLVPLPLPNSKPVDGLAVIDGWCCGREGCRNLCASEKRMRFHWSEVHGVKDLGVEGVGWKRKCRLQTFFRGTKIRYFEVTEEEGVTIGEAATEIDTEIMDEPELAPEPPRPKYSTLSIQPPKILDLETLTYFHHFTTSTSYTLPSISPSPENNWQSIIPLALKDQHLMFGILGISAYHSASLGTNNTLENTARLSKAKEFSIAFASIPKDEPKTENRASEKQTQLILYFASVSFTLPQKQEKLDIHALLSTIHSLSNTNTTSKTNNSTHLLTNTANIPPHALKTLNALPHTLATAFPSPKNSQAEDIFSVLHAIRDLISCVGISYESISEINVAPDVRGNIWKGVIRWCELLSARFMGLIERGDDENGSGGGPAEVVVYFWAAFLLKRAKQEVEGQREGYWFLNGLAERLGSEILEGLPPHVRVLVEELHI